MFEEAQKSEVERTCDSRVLNLKFVDNSEISPLAETRRISYYKKFVTKKPLLLPKGMTVLGWSNFSEILSVMIWSTGVAYFIWRKRISKTSRILICRWDDAGTGGDIEISDRKKLEALGTDLLQSIHILDIGSELDVNKLTVLVRNDIINTSDILF